VPSPDSTLALPEEARGSLEELERRLGALEAALGPLLGADALVSDPQEKARLSLTLGHAAAALFVTSLRCRGVAVDSEHPARAALERVNRYMRTAAEHEVAPPRNAVLDCGAAERFVPPRSATAPLNGRPQQRRRQLERTPSLVLCCRCCAACCPAFPAFVACCACSALLAAPSRVPRFS
jgi:hypothetical protein